MRASMKTRGTLSVWRLSKMLADFSPSMAFLQETSLLRMRRFHSEILVQMIAMPQAIPAMSCSSHAWAQAATAIILKESSMMSPYPSGKMASGSLSVIGHFGKEKVLTQVTHSTMNSMRELEKFMVQTGLCLMVQSLPRPLNWKTTNMCSSRMFNRAIQCCSMLNLMNTRSWQTSMRGDGLKNTTKSGMMAMKKTLGLMSTSVMIASQPRGITTNS